MLPFKVIYSFQLRQFLKLELKMRSIKVSIVRKTQGSRV